MRLLRVIFVSLLLCSFAVAFGQNSKWDKLSAAGNQAYVNRNYPAAEQAFLEALKEAEKSGKKDQRLASTLNDLGSIYFAWQKLPEAEYYFKKAIDVWRVAEGSDGLPSLALQDRGRGVWVDSLLSTWSGRSRILGG